MSAPEESDRGPHEVRAAAAAGRDQAFSSITDPNNDQIGFFPGFADYGFLGMRTCMWSS
jgi:hypothetical protein